jgi:hypothetical protein
MILENIGHQYELIVKVGTLNGKNQLRSRLDFYKYINIRRKNMEIIIGIISGLLTIFILWILRLMYINSFSPWVRKIKYSGISIKGEWRTELTIENEVFKEKVEVFQNGTSVKGRFTLQKEKETRIYEFTGKYSDLILTGIYEQKGKKSTDRGSFTLRLFNDGKSFIGITSLYSFLHEDIVPGKYIWHREK